MRVRYLLPAAVLILGTASCSAKNKGMPGARDSGQSRLMDQTFAGQNSCNPENHKRPFIIEWDATDMSSFEAQAANDIVVVKYEGCNLVVLDECKNDALRGEQGSYMPPEWTSGSLETIDIKTAGELVAKLPLGVATLGGRVAGGEKFHMEYFVAGTRNATRDSVYRADLEDNPGCEGATHFVYGYNLGAFALGSAADVEVQAGGSAYGFGAETNLSKSQSAEKKGGDLSVCKADDATEVQGCKAPIRLSLREVRDGESPDATAMKAPDTDASVTAAGQINMKLDMSDNARRVLESAQRKLNAGDGKGCLADLKAHGKLDPDHDSAKPSSPFAFARARCVMMSGKCDAGKVQARKWMEAQGWNEQYGPDWIDKQVEIYAAQNCKGKLGPRDSLLRALQALQTGAYMAKKDTKYCDKHFGTIKKLRGKVKPKNDEDTQIKSLDSAMYSMAPTCYAKAGNCKKAFTVFKEVSEWMNPGAWDKLDKELAKKMKRDQFESIVQKCKGK